MLYSLLFLLIFAFITIVSARITRTKTLVTSPDASSDARPDASLDARPDARPNASPDARSEHRLYQHTNKNQIWSLYTKYGIKNQDVEHRFPDGPYPGNHSFLKDLVEGGHTRACVTAKDEIVDSDKYENECLTHFTVKSSGTGEECKEFPIPFIAKSDELQYVIVNSLRIALKNGPKTSVSITVGNDYELILTPKSEQWSKELKTCLNSIDCVVVNYRDETVLVTSNYTKIGFEDKPLLSDNRHMKMLTHVYDTYTVVTSNKGVPQISIIDDSKTPCVQQFCLSWHRQHGSEDRYIEQTTVGNFLVYASKMLASDKSIDRITISTNTSFAIILRYCLNFEPNYKY